MALLNSTEKLPRLTFKDIFLYTHEQIPKNLDIAPFKYVNMCVGVYVITCIAQNRYEHFPTKRVNIDISSAYGQRG